jgi:galactose-1-phosphate uridylyltransferase|tara:strand:+ start:474 stop:656 length:183 start_codon:yes stop_codon:yes gene_type:complete
MNQKNYQETMKKAKKKTIQISEETHKLYVEWCNNSGRRIGATADILIKLGIITYDEKNKN